MPRHARAILAIILLSYLMILLDNSVVFTALPSLRADLDLSPTELSWVQDAYTLVFGGLLLLGARAGDLLGRRRVFVAGLLIFSLASLLISLAPAAWWLIAARALQGVGAAIIAPTSLALITSSFAPGAPRGRAVAAYAATAGVGASLGLVVGGAAAQLISWRAGFVINVPIGAAMILLAPRFLPEAETARGRFDLPGALLTTLGSASLVAGILRSAEAGWGDPSGIVLLVLGVLLLGALVLAESRAAQPIMPLRLFTDRERAGAYLARLLYVAAMIGFFFFTTQLLQDALGWTALQAGLGYLPMTVVNAIVALALARLQRRVAAGPVLVTGVVVTLAGMVWLAQVGEGSSYLTAVALPMLLIGGGQGLAFAPLTSAGIAGADGADAGAAAGVVTTFQQVGRSLGLGIMVAASAGAGSTVAEVRVAFTTGSVLLALALVAVLALLLPGQRARRRVEELVTVA